jgi:hypothetical protein
MAGKLPFKPKKLSGPAYGSAKSGFKKNPLAAAMLTRGSDLQRLDSTLGLSTFESESDTKPAPAGMRLPKAEEAHIIYLRIRQDDEVRSIGRARVDAMFDGAPPLDQAKLVASRQSNVTNVNFGQAARILSIALSAYVDLYSSLETFVEVHSKYPDLDAESSAKETIVAEEITALLRGWPEFHTNYLRLCTTFIKHGVGVAYFDRPKGFRFRVCGLQDFLVPQQTTASEESATIAFARSEYRVDELFGFIQNPKAAKAVGWVPEEVLRVLKTCVSASSNAALFGALGRGADHEAWQAAVKNGDLALGHRNPLVVVVHCWVRETDGTVTHCLFSEQAPKEFLYRKVSRFKKPENAFVFFTNGVGTNGTLHSIRGIGQPIFPHIQALNKLRCRGVDGAMMGSSIMVQPLNQRGMDELEFSYYGAYAVLSPDAKIVEKALPNMAQVLKPVMDDLTDQLLQNTDTMTAYGPDRGSPYRNTVQVASDLEITSRISGSSINLFYLSWERLLREVVARILDKDSGKDEAIAEFYTRCEERGVDRAFISTLDPKRTEATRSVGEGSAANRMMVQKELAAMAGQFDEVGQKNLLHDRVAALVGHKMARRYAPPPSQTSGPRETVDTKMAELENTFMEMGRPVSVKSSEMHGQHLDVHLPKAQELLSGIEEGAIDPVQALPIMSLIYQHLSDTANFAVSNPNLQVYVKQVSQIMQLLEEQINNAMKAEAAAQRDQMAAEEEAAAQAQAQAQGGQAGPEGAMGPEMGMPDPKVARAMQELELRRAHAELDMDLTRRRAELDMSIREQEARQRQALKDAETAGRIRNQVALQDARAIRA